MKEREQSRVMPFRMSGVRHRATARDYRRRGQVLESLSLVRRAAMQDDTAASWQALAAELRQMACWEAAGVVLAQVISRQDAPPAAWLDMARCLSAQGKRGLAEDCLYYLLNASPWSPEADAGREMLQAMAEEVGQEEPHRVALLSQRAMIALHTGQRELGLRRLRRAVRLSSCKAELLITLSLMYLMNEQSQEAVKCLARAMKAEPDNARAACAMAALLYQMERPRAARGVLRMAAKLCVSPEMEMCFCSTAELLLAWPELKAYLRDRLGRMPHRIPLLHARARMEWMAGCHGEARELFKQILAIDPTDCEAAALLAWSQAGERFMPQRGQMPAPEMVRHPERLMQAEALFRWGSEAYNALEWCITSGEPEVRQQALSAVAGQPDRDAEIRWLRQIVARPDLEEPLRQQALMRLSDLNHREPLFALVGGRYGTLQFHQETRSLAQRTWRCFLPVLLRVAARYGCVSEIVVFAADLWPTLTASEQQEAATGLQRCWGHMLLTLWLWKQGRSEEADREMHAVHLPMRHFRRLVGRFMATMEKDTGNTGEGEP